MSVSAPADPSFVSPKAQFFVYILRCSDDTLYIGHTSDLESRLKVHNEGRGAIWTACRRPVSLAYHETHHTEEAAIARERQLKRWTHNKKLALIRGDRATLKSLAKRRVY